ncbi:MAG: FtsX-like permease family protein [Verrucomicrobia bacterium]|nr:FtsX-like permease family protein [Verrucomicrobiota bacterium]MCH8510758.1 ABC transporter permease [Kiritimatiellia bacterium]
MSRTSRPMQPALILRLALADLRHEWILTFCLVLAISAVIAPLLLLFGLKHGTIETLRMRLVEDPKNREIRPMASLTFTRDWFEEMANRPDVAFLTPMTRQISASVTARIAGKDGSADLDLVPTGPGDALLLENGAPIPGEQDAVLSALAAESLNAVPGDVLVVDVTRVVGNRRERASVELRVAGTTSLRAGAQRLVYVPLALIEQVEAYRDGQAVPELGWSGSQPEAYPLFDGVVVATKEPMTVLLQQRLRANSGFTQSRDLPAGEVEMLLGYPLRQEAALFALSTQIRPAGMENLNAVRTQLRGQNASMLPWVKPMRATLIEHGHELEIRVLPAEATSLGVLPSPALLEEAEKGPIPAILPEGIAETGALLELEVANDTGTLHFPVRVAGTHMLSEPTLFLPERVGGILRLSETRPLRYDPERGVFLMYRRGYAGFRMYARNIEDVAMLRQLMESQNIPVHTEAERIHSVQEMDRYLTLIFWLVATVGIAGSVASLVASLYASVERKRRELGVLRLIGLPSSRMFRFPVYQGVLIATGGFGVALMFFHLLANTINHMFASHLQTGERFCFLPVDYTAMALGGVVAVAALSAVAAVVRLARIDPAEALRDE